MAAVPTVFAACPDCAVNEVIVRVVMTPTPTTELCALTADQLVPNRVVTRYVYEPVPTPESVHDVPVIGAANVLPQAAVGVEPDIRSTKYFNV
ncbi:MAG: hypothetical protein JWL79_3565 [Frankiales bacterium]|nr:hypothetical protein [Frankiales bacterium]